MKNGFFWPRSGAVCRTAFFSAAHLLFLSWVLLYFLILFFSISRTIFSHSRSDRFLKQNTIYPLPLLFFRMLVKRDPNALPLMELNPNFQQMRPTEEIDSRIITKVYMCPICLGKLVDPMHGGDHITRFHRIRYVDQMRLGLKLTEVPIWLRKNCLSSSEYRSNLLFFLLFFPGYRVLFKSEHYG